MDGHGEDCSLPIILLMFLTDRTTHDSIRALRRASSATTLPLFLNGLMLMLLKDMSMHRWWAKTNLLSATPPWLSLWTRMSLRRPLQRSLTPGFLETNGAIPTSLHLSSGWILQGLTSV